MYTSLPSSFFVAPVSSRMVPASRSTCRRSSISTSLCIRQPKAKGDGYLQVRPEPPADGVVLVALEEPGPRRCLLQLPDDGQPKDLPILVGEAQHPGQGGELPIDRAVRRAFLLAVADVGRDLRAADPRHTASSKELVEVGESGPGLPKGPLARCLVVAPEIVGNLVVSDPINARQDWLASRHPTFPTPNLTYS